MIPTAQRPPWPISYDLGNANRIWLCSNQSGIHKYTCKRVLRRGTTLSQPSHLTVKRGLTAEMSALFDQSNPYGSSSGYGGYGGQDGGGGSSNPNVGRTNSNNLQFYSGNAGGAYDGYSSTSGGISGGRHSLEGNMGSSGTAYGGSAVDRSMINSQMSFWSAFGTGGFPDEPGLMEELGVNLPHILDKSLTVLNPLHRYSAHHTHDAHMMDDTDLAGPLIFCFAFGMLLLLAGKSQFGYIYGVALMGDLSIYLLLNMMSEKGIDAYRVASVLGYCILPLTLLSFVAVFVTLE